MHETSTESPSADSLLCTHPPALTTMVEWSVINMYALGNALLVCFWGLFFVWVCLVLFVLVFVWFFCPAFLFCFCF